MRTPWWPRRPLATRLSPANLTYTYNPACPCQWCENGGVNPTPGAPAALGYDVAHHPPSRSPWAESPTQEAA